MVLQNGSADASVYPNLNIGSLVIEGKLHNEISLGCQDACHLVQSSDLKVAVVCDGCSTTDLGFTQNQTGAILGAYCWSNFLAKALRDSNKLDDLLFEKALRITSNRTKSFFIKLCKGLDLAFPSNEWRDFVLNKLLFTVLGFAVVRNRYWVFGLGDGCFGINNDVTPIDNSPTPYFNQLLLEKNRSQKLKVVIHTSGEIETLKCLWVASDGLNDVLSSSTGKKDFSNFLKDEFTCGRNKKGEDTTIQAFRRTVYKHHLRRFSDDIALALVKIDTTATLNLGNTEGEKDE